ncbi:MAG: DNA polymerase III subunit delta [Oscillospiraceae bacterium]|nr:DNA polymerase III subunit delta [Oscillospiraceae bacterium]
MAYQKNNDGLTALKAALREKQPGRLYVFYGEESYLKRYYLDMLRKQLLSGPAEAFNFHRFTPETMSLDGLQDAVEALPMMAERTLVQVDDFDLFKGAEADRERMTAMLSDLPDYCCLVFCYDTVEYKPDKRQKKLVAALTEHGTEVEFRKQDARELGSWVRRHFLKYRKDIDDKLCQYLIFRTGGSMTALVGEIEKVCAYSGQDVICRADIDAVVEPVLDAVVFDITDAIAGGDYGLALGKLRTLFQMQEEPIPILGAIGAQMRRMRCAKVLAAGGKGGDSLMKLCGIGDYPARKTMAAAVRVTQGFCDRAVLLCTETDYQMKTSYDDPERLLGLLLLRLSEEAKHG